MTAKSSLGPSGNLDRERTLARAWSENTHSLALLLAADGTILDLNPPTADCLGLPAAEWKGRLFWAEASEAEREAWQAPFRKVLANGKAVRADVERKGRWYDASFSPGLDPAGKVVGVAIVGWDITERKRAEQERSRREWLLRSVIDASADYIFVKDRELRTVLCNKVFAEAVGKKPEQLLGKTDIENGWDPELVKGNPAKGIRGYEGDDQAALRDETVRVEGERGNVRTGIRVFETIKGPLRDETGAIVAMMGVSRDITERKRAEAAFRESEERQQAQIENLVNGFAYCWMIYQDGKPHDFVYLRVNRAFEELSGLKDVVGRKVSEVIPNIREVDPQVLEVYGRVARTGVSERFEIHLKTLDMWFEVAVSSPERDYFVAVFVAHDIECRRMSGNLCAQKLLRLPPTANYSKSAPADERPAHFRPMKDGCEIPPERLPVQMAAKGQEVRDYEFSLAFDDGRVRTLAGDAVPLLDAGGRRRGAVGVFVDITERKRAEELIREREEALRFTLENTRVGWWDMDPATRKVWRSDQDARLFGYEDARGPWDYEIFLNRHVNPEDREWVRGACENGIASGKGWEFECRIIRVDQVTRWVWAKAAITKFANGQAKRILGLIMDITERKQAEEAQARLAAIVEGSEDAIISKSREGVVLTWNRAAERMFGYRPDEIIGRSMMMLLPPERQHEETLILSGLLQGETIRDYETVRLTKDGRRLEVALTASPLKDSAGRVTGASKILRDITERKRAEAALQKVARTNQLLHTSIVALNACPDLDAALACLVKQAIVLGGMDAGGAYLIEGSEAVLRHQVGLSPEFVEKVARRPLSTPYIRATLEHPQEVLNFVERFPEHHRLGAAYGLRHIYCMALLADGEPFGMLAVASRRAEPPQAGDIELIRILAAETQSLFVRFGVQQRLRAVQAAMAEGLVVQAADGTITDCNPSAERILGLTRDQLMGRTSVDPRWQAVREDGSAFPGTEHPAMVSLRTGQSCRDVIMGLRLPDGGQRWININAEPMFKRGETRPYAGVASFSDITEHRQMEARLRQAQKTEAIAHLTGGIAHQFNNILAGILLGVELVKTPGTQGENPEVLEDMESGCQRAAGLVRQLLALSQQSVMQQRSLDLGATVSEQLGALRELLGEGIKLEFTRPDALSRVKADEALIKQVLRNLCLNAREAMKRGGVVRLELSEEEVGPEREKACLDARAGRFVRLSVSDTGCGMDEGTIKRLFEPFFTTKGVGEGTGLGLATVRGIVQQHQGWVEAESQLGKGTTFKVYLPVEALVAETAVATTAKEQVVGGGGTILLAEDEPGLRKVTRRFLDRQGYQVLEAADGEEALAVWAAHRAEIDLIFTDMVMPGRLSGLDVAQRALAEKPGVNVVITSGHNTDRLELERACEGRILYLPKPCPMEELVALLRRCLGKGFPGGRHPRRRPGGSLAVGWDDLAPSKEQRPDKALRFLTKLKTPKQKQSAPSLGSTASAGNMAFPWTPSRRRSGPYKTLSRKNCAPRLVAGRVTMLVIARVTGALVTLVQAAFGPRAKVDCSVGV